MMINLSAFIQFIGALYLSIAIDSALFKRFWNPDFFAMMSSYIGQYTDGRIVDISTELSNKLTDTAKNISEKADSNSRMQGGLMLIYAVALLIAFGFRNDFGYEQIGEVSLCLSLFMYLGLLSFFLARFILKSWGHVFITSAVVLFIPFLVFIPWASELLDGLSLSALWMKIVLVAFLLLPIVWRIFYNWLYSSVYSKYIHARIDNEYQTYIQTKEQLKNNHSDKIDSRYHSILADFFNNRGEQDTENKCAERYVELIAKQCEEIPGIFKLLKHRYDKIENNEVVASVKETVQPLSRPTTTSPQFEELFNKYERLKNPIKLQDFCRENHVNYDEFREYRKNRLSGTQK